MDAMMMKLTSAPAASSANGGAKGRAGSGSKESFAEYMDRKLSAESNRKNLLGAKASRRERPVGNGAVANEKGSAREDVDEGNAAQNVATLLQQFLEKLQEMAKNGESTPGEWSFTLPDQGLLKQVAADAGLNDQELAALLAQARKEDGVISLQAFLATLANHFEQQGKEQKITVPETDLPPLETLLSKLGVPVEQIVDVVDQSVGGDGRLDLTAFLKGLEKVEENGKPFVLSAWETDQLRDILARAGVSEQLQADLLSSPSGKDVPFSLGRLQEMLRQGIADVKAGRPQLKLAAFAGDLKRIFAEANFIDKGVGWSPAVQGAVAATYEELLKSVDLSTAQVKVVPAVAAAPGQDVSAAMKEGQDQQDGVDDFWATAEEEAAAGAKGKTAGNDRAAQGDHAGGMGPEQAVQPAASGVHDAVLGGGAHNTAPHQAGNSAGDVVGTGRAPAPEPPLPPQLGQQTFDSISQGVVRGLKNDEHHLVLRLFPKELGEVKVDMMVRENHVSINFAMENSRVKQTLESNMQQFQDNLAKQGFVLNGCQVSVGQQQDSGSAWQSFEQARQQMGRGGAKGKRETLADLSGDIMYIRPLRGADHAGGISLLI